MYKINNTVKNYVQDKNTTKNLQISLALKQGNNIFKNSNHHRSKPFNIGGTKHSLNSLNHNSATSNDKDTPLHSPTEKSYAKYKTYHYRGFQQLDQQKVQRLPHL